MESLRLRKIQAEGIGQIKTKITGFLLERDIVLVGGTRQQGATEDFRAEKKLN